MNDNERESLVGAGVIWSFWEGQPPDLVLRCFESIRVNNTTRPFIIVSKATLPKFLDKTDFPLFHGRHGNLEDFTKVQYLADWVRLSLLEKYGGIWLDASVICTSSVDSWIVEEDAIVYDSDEENLEKAAIETSNSDNKKVIHVCQNGTLGLVSTELGSAPNTHYANVLQRGSIKKTDVPNACEL